MKLQVFEDYERLSRWAADEFITAVQARPDLLMCLATGGTPTRCYEHLAERAQTEPDLFRQVKVIKLDEWVGLPSNAPQTCEYYLVEHILKPMQVTEDRYISFDPMAQDPEAHCKHIQDALGRAGPIDLCMLGLGINGHLGFIEPQVSLELHAHVATLSEESRRHAMVKSVKEPPRNGLTLGIKDILQARKVILLVNGSHKREVLGRLLQDSISTHLPASFLHLHPDAVCAVDKEAVPPHRL